MYYCSTGLLQNVLLPSLSALLNVMMPIVGIVKTKQDIAQAANQASMATNVKVHVYLYMYVHHAYREDIDFHFEIKTENPHVRLLIQNH